MLIFKRHSRWGVLKLQITTKLGQEIISRIEEYIEVDINIMDLNGKIVASTDKSRIDSIHSGAIKVIETGNPLILNERNVHDYKGAKQGANLPIMHQSKIEGVVGVSGNPEEIIPMTGLIRASVEIVLAQMHVQEQAYYQERQWNFWLQQLLHPSGLNKEKLEEEAVYSLHIHTKSFWTVMILYGENVQDFLQVIRREISIQKINTLFTLPFSGNQVIIAVPSEVKDLDPLVKGLMGVTQDNISIGVGEGEFGIAGIRKSYKQAKQAVLFEKEIGTVSYSKAWRIERLAAAIHEDEYNSICLPYEKLLKELGDIYIKTVDTYLSMNFSIKKTANLLHIHRNTLLYRLDQIKERVGLDPRSFHDAFILKVIRSKQI